MDQHGTIRLRRVAPQAPVTDPPSGGGRGRTRRFVPVAVAATVGMLCGGGFVGAQTPTTTDTFHACVDNSNGNLRLVSAGTQCKRSERGPVSWN